MRLIKLVITAILCILPLCCFPLESNKEDSSVKLLTERGYSLYELERYSEALECYTRALDRATQVSDYKSKIISIGNIANIFAIYGDYDRSIYYNRMGYDLALQEKDLEMQIRFACMLVEISCCNDDVKSAEDYYNMLMGIPAKWSMSDKYHCLVCQAVIAKAKKKVSEAIYYYKRAQDFAADHKMHPKYVIMTSHELGKIYLDSGDINQALAEYKKALDISKKINSDEMISETYQLYSAAYKKGNNPVLAEKYKAWAVQISDSIFNKKRFNYAKNKLFEYEDRVKNEKIVGLNKRINEQMIIITLISVILVMLVVFMAIIIVKNKRLHEAHRLLLDKMNDLDRQEKKNKELRKNVLDTNLLDKILTIMEDVDIISRPDFGLNTLVNMLHSNTSYVSWCINDSLGKNFKTLLNEYRIKEACRRLSDTDTYGNMTVQAVYEDLGYKSASNFIKAFKTVVGMTPSQYQRIIKEKKQIEPAK